MEDLIQDVHALFDEHPSPPPPISNASETTTLDTTFLSPELSRFAEVQVVGSRTVYRPGIGGIRSLASTRSSLSLPSDAVAESRRTPSPAPLLSLGLPSSHTLKGVEMTAQDELISPDATTIPQSPHESVISSTSDFPLSSATSLRTRMGPLSP